jgi:hypothetical protein
MHSDFLIRQADRAYSSIGLTITKVLGCPDKKKKKKLCLDVNTGY